MNNHPTAEAVKAARKAAGHTQAQAAAVVGAGHFRTWQDWERGVSPMPPGLFELYFLKTEYLPDLYKHAGCFDVCGRYSQVTFINSPMVAEFVKKCKDAKYSNTTHGLRV